MCWCSYPTFPMKYQTAFVEGLTAVLNSTDPDVKVTYKTVRLNGTNGRRLLQVTPTALPGLCTAVC